jgi:GMP synthase (glutamine-hydrolysing)
VVLVLDFGSQTTQLIARRIREAQVYCEILPCTTPLEVIRARHPRALVLSGGPSSVYDEGAPSVDPRSSTSACPSSASATACSCSRTSAAARSSAPTTASTAPPSSRRRSEEGIFARYTEGTSSTWMSHGDRIAAMPTGFVDLGTSDNTPFCAVAHHEKRIYGVQFHPEVVHTPRGRRAHRGLPLRRRRPRAELDAASFVDEEAIQRCASASATHTRLRALRRRRLLVAAVLCHARSATGSPASSSTTACLREGEAEQVVATFRDGFHLNLLHVDASQRFLDALSGVTDPEQKRKIIGRVFIDVFEQEAKKIDTRASSCRARSTPTSSRASRSRGRAPSSRATTTSAACPSA